MIRLFLVDDHPLVRDGLRVLLTREGILRQARRRGGEPGVSFWPTGTLGPGLLFAQRRPAGNDHRPLTHSFPG